MKERLNMIKTNRISLKLLLSYLAIILAPAIAIVIIYSSMQRALLDVQTERAKNLSQSTVVAFDKEIEMVTNIGEYVSTDSDLQQYLNKIPGKSMVQKYFGAYQLANNYPDYSLINDFVKSVYILSEDADYVICIPKVIPSSKRGIATFDLNLLTNGGEYQDVTEKLKSLGRQELIYEEDENGIKSFYTLDSFNFGSQKGQRGYVVVEIEQKQIKELLKSMLGTESGTTMLVDADGKILYSYELMTGVKQKVADSENWQEYMEANGWNQKHMIVTEVKSEYNGWSFITLIPREELLSKIYDTQLPILALCMVSVMIGVGICLMYWNQSRPVVKQYMDFSEKHPEKTDAAHQNASIWKNISCVFTHVEILQDTVDKQKQWAKEGILRNILFGSYDSHEELDRELKMANLLNPVKFPCYIVVLDVENPMHQEINLLVDAFEKVLKECLDEYIPCEWQIVGLGTWNYALFIMPYDHALDGRQLKKIFEDVNYELYNKLPVNIYTGISDRAESIMAIMEEYEHVCRVCEYGKYYKLRVPLLLEEIPKHQHVVFTVELEMQLERAIKSGAEEQLGKLMEQVNENYLTVSAGSKPIHQHLEVLRCVLMRCFAGENEAMSTQFVEQVQHIKTVAEMNQAIFDCCRYFNRKKAETETSEEAQLKQKVESIIGREYYNPEFNLAMLADAIDVQEKKLYRDFKKMFGISFSSYLEVLRIQSAQELLKKGHAVQEVAEAVGYSSDYSFRRAFKRVVGVTPSDYQKM